MQKVKGDFVVIDFKIYKQNCDYRWIYKNKEYCAFFGRDSKIQCKSKECPFAEVTFEELVYEPYKKLPYIA